MLIDDETTTHSTAAGRLLLHRTRLAVAAVDVTRIRDRFTAPNPMMRVDHGLCTGGGHRSAATMGR